jgi:hypothetical protein
MRTLRRTAKPLDGVQLERMRLAPGASWKHVANEVSAPFAARSFTSFGSRLPACTPDSSPWAALGEQPYARSCT